mgnify:CR=1 FL=1
MKIKQTQLGLTLMEVVIVVGLFSGLILATTRMFIRTTDVQQRTVNEHDLQADLKYGLGVLLYEAEKDIIKCTAPDVCNCGSCGNLSDEFYGLNAGSTALCFFNSTGICVEYFLENDKIKVKRGVIEEELTSSQITISDLKFDLGADADRFTVMAKASKTDQKYDQELILQTSITATNYEN